MPCRTPRELRELARGRQIPCTCHFPSGKNAFPGHAQWHMLRRPREGVEQREERCAKPSFSNWESIHFGRHGLRVDASFWKTDAFHQEYARFQSCFVPLYFWRISCTAPGGTRGARRGRSPGRRFSIQKGRPGRPVLSPQLSPPAASLKARTAAATQREHANLAASAGKPTLSEMRRSNASSNYC